MAQSSPGAKRDGAAPPVKHFDPRKAKLFLLDFDALNNGPSCFRMDAAPKTPAVKTSRCMRKRFHEPKKACSAASARQPPALFRWSAFIRAVLGRGDRCRKNEGKVVVYSAHVGNPLLKAMGDAFTARYGIQVERLEARASELRERTRVEYSAGRNTADVTFTSSGQAVSSITRTRFSHAIR